MYMKKLKLLIVFIEYWNVLIFIAQMFICFFTAHLFSMLDVDYTFCVEDPEICKRLSKRILQQKTSYGTPVVYDFEKTADGDGGGYLSFKAGGLRVPFLGKPEGSGCVYVNKDFLNLLNRGNTKK